ncbi:MAG: HNH endonuclease [Legionella sp.]|nr:HNH endonuclease [Legionella sp.]
MERLSLHPLGHKVAEGRVTQGEFAAIMVQQTVLPNLQTYTPSEFNKWQEAGLEIKPLSLILQLLDNLGELGIQNAYLTPNELIKAVIPLAGSKVPNKDIARILMDIRNGKINTEGWPNCAPEANDRRLAREFLLFLANNGICRFVSKKTEYDGRYYLDELFDVNAVSALTEASIFVSDKEANEVVEAIRNSPLPSIIERQRTVITILSRPRQPMFRKHVLKCSENKCLLTGEKISEILEAAHIIPVTNGGSDDKDNGICLRIDIHRLFDSGNIRIQPTGDLKFSDAVTESENYKNLPSKISIPNFVNMANIEWREKYC